MSPLSEEILTISSVGLPLNQTNCSRSALPCTAALLGCHHSPVVSCDKITKATEVDDSRHCQQSA